MFNAQRTISASWNAAAVAAALAIVFLLMLTGCSGSTVKGSFDAYSWSELSAIATEIHDAETDAEGIEIAESYNLLSGGKPNGKTKSVTLSDGTKATVAIAGVRQDDLASGGKAGLTLVFTSAPVTHAMNPESTNDGGWEKSEMRSWLNDEFIGMLPSDLKGAIVAANKKTNSSGLTTPGAVSSTSDKLWLPSLVEVSGSISPNSLFGANGSGIPAATYDKEGKQYQLFSAKGVTAGEENDVLQYAFTGDDSNGSGIVVSGEASPWWLRSLSTTWTSGFEAVSAEGDPQNAWIPDYELGVAPGFCL